MTDLIEEIKTAYKIHRLRPIRGYFFIKRKSYNFACPLAALAIHRGVLERTNPGFEFDGGAVDGGAIDTVEWAAQTYGQAWVNGFLDAFDGKTVTGTDLKYQEGYSLGAALAQEILPAA